MSNAVILHSNFAHVSQLSNTQFFLCFFIRKFDLDLQFVAQYNSPIQFSVQLIIELSNGKWLPVFHESAKLLLVEIPIVQRKKYKTGRKFENNKTTCNVCDEEKDLSNFCRPFQPKTNSHVYCTVCRDCLAKQKTDYLKRSPRGFLLNMATTNLTFSLE